VSHESNNHFLALGWHMELVRSPCLHFPTCNKLVANQYHSWRTTFFPIPLMRKNEVILHLLSSFFKLVAMSIRDWLSTQKHPKYYHEKFLEVEFAWNFQTWHMIQILCSLCSCNWKGEVLLVFGHHKMDKEKNF